MIERKLNSLIGRKSNSLRRGEVVQVEVAFGVVGLRRADEEQAGPLETGSKVVQVVIAEGVVGLVGVNDEQSGLLEKALHLEWITKRLFKVRTWSCLIERFNSLKRGEVVQVEVAFGVIGLRSIDEEQVGSPETGSKVVQVMVV